MPDDMNDFVNEVYSNLKRERSKQNIQRYISVFVGIISVVAASATITQFKLRQIFQPIVSKEHMRNSIES
jgi:hypothetical protein